MASQERNDRGEYQKLPNDTQDVLYAEQLLHCPTLGTPKDRQGELNLLFRERIKQHRPKPFAARKQLPRCHIEKEMRTHQREGNQKRVGRGREQAKGNNKN